MTAAALERLAPELATAIRQELWKLAKLEDDLANAEAAETPYWRPCSPSVVGHRAAAHSLRAAAERLEADTYPHPLAS